MLFNSIDFAIFFPIVFVLYWLVSKNLILRNVLILVSSYVFYGWEGKTSQKTEVYIIPSSLTLEEVIQ
ncbi:MAG: hypothetical protein R2802_08260 [Flavobacteriaceae bacterium]|nr:hypothetical protein [Mangrovimonas sp.]MCB0437202.1 hypothetical protein [Mangrovimonas sp.]